MRKGNIFIPVLAIVGAVIVVAAVAVLMAKTDLIINHSSNKPVACTADAKLCPDGSYVGRVAPDCKFANCPVTNTNSKTTGTFETGGNVNAAVNTNNAVVNNAVNDHDSTIINSAIDTTTGLKIYNNETLGYTVKYPADWNVYTCSDVTAVWFGTVKIPCQSEGGAGDFAVQPMESSFNLTNTITQDKADMVNSVETTVVVDGITATRLTGEGKAEEFGYFPNGYYKDEVYVKHGNIYYLILFMKSGTAKQYVSEFNNFLSTFRFTK